MDQLIPFMINHWVLTAVFVSTLLLLLFLELKSHSGGNRLSPAEATQLINRENATIIDIRPFDQFKDGHIPNAINIPHSDLSENLGKIKKYQQKPIILVCTQGQTAMLLAKKLTQEGFLKVYVLAGGLTSWRHAGFLLIKK